MYKNKFAKKYPGSYPKKIGILPGVTGLFCTRIVREREGRGGMQGKII